MTEDKIFEFRWFLVGVAKVEDSDEASGVCECCGKNDLKWQAHLVNSVGDELWVGTQCAAKLRGTTALAVEKEIKELAPGKREAESRWEEWLKLVKAASVTVVWRETPPGYHSPRTWTESIAKGEPKGLGYDPLNKASLAKFARRMAEA